MKAEVEKFWEGPLWGEPPREQFTLNPAGAQVPGETQRRGLEEKAGPTLGKSRRASRRVSSGTAFAAMQRLPRLCVAPRRATPATSRGCPRASLLRTK